MDTLGLRLKAAREKQGYTIQQLHQLTSIEENNLIAFEEDRYTPPLSMLFTLQKYLKCTVEWLLGGEEPEIAQIRSTPACDEIPLSPAENDLVAMFRLLDQHGREFAFDVITTLYERVVGERNSAYSAYEENSDQDH